MNHECYMNNYISKKVKYAKAYVPLQPYENLFSLDDVLRTGTIFMDLYDSYEHHKNHRYSEVEK